MTRLRGVTWSHSRAYSSIVAASEAYTDRHPEVEVTWDKRSLFEFGQGSLDRLAGTYDFVILDHPSIGTAADSGLIRALNDLLGPSEITILAEQSVGPTHSSYEWDGRQWALAIDAAHQVAVVRDDLLKEMPTTWDGVVTLSGDSDVVALPLAPADAFSAFMTLYGHLGGMTSDQHFVMPFEAGTATAALRQLRRLTDLIGPRWHSVNAIDFLREMSHTSGIAYCPLVYGYSNYSRDGFAVHRLRFSDFPPTTGTASKGAILGGAGIAITSSCRETEAAAGVASWLAGAECQTSVYTLSGGQPGNRLAWDDATLDDICGGFLTATRWSLDNAAVRPNHPGFFEYQESAITAVHQCISSRSSVESTIEFLVADYHRFFSQNQDRERAAT